MGSTSIDRLARELYDARLSGDLDRVCRVFATDATFRIASAGMTDPVAIEAAGLNQLRPLLAFMIKTFKLGDMAIRTMEIEGDRARVHWQAKVRSRITGATVPTEFIDMVEVRDGRIVNFDEVCVAR